jgi:hypothetical protein
MQIFIQANQFKWKGEGKTNSSGAKAHPFESENVGAKAPTPKTARRFRG